MRTLLFLDESFIAESDCDIPVGSVIYISEYTAFPEIRMKLKVVKKEYVVTIFEFENKKQYRTQIEITCMKADQQI